MDEVTVIDHFLDIFSRYIDSGFGMVHGEVAWLSATLVAIDMTLAGLWWALAHASGQGADVMAKLIRLYVGAFAFLIGHFNTLAGIVFRSFAGLELNASASNVATDKFLQPGRLAKTGIDAAAPILDQISWLASRKCSCISRRSSCCSSLGSSSSCASSYWPCSSSSR